MARRPVFPHLTHSSLSEGLKWLGAGSRDMRRKGTHSMPLYEHVYLARQDASAQQVEALTAQYKGVIEQMGGKITKAEYWGVKSLSYRIRKNRKAHMTLLNVDAPATALAEIERQERLNEDVLRYLTVRVDAHEEGPSAMMRKVDRDRERDRDRDERRGFDRGDRGDRGERGERRRDRNGRGREGAEEATATADEE
jgi:small subunit ribosomal protein S6